MSSESVQRHKRGPKKRLSNTAVVTFNFEEECIKKMDDLCKILNLSRSEFARASIVKEIKRMDKRESVYLARAVSGGFFEKEDGGGLYKIGRSKDPTRRIAQLNSPATKLPYTLELVCAFESANADLTERMLQKYFESKAMPNSNEYFMLSGQDVQIITMRNFPPEIIHSIYQEYA